METTVSLGEGADGKKVELELIGGLWQPMRIYLEIGSLII